MNIVDRECDAGRLIGPGDPPVYELVNSASKHPVVLVCEHAGRAIPARLGSLGLTDDDMDRHIAWDIGAAGLTRKIAQILGAPAILQNYSRLLIDCNRPPDQSGSIPAVSDQTRIPGNQDLTTSERDQRIEDIFNPFHDRVSNLLDQNPRQLVLAIHSFTPVLAGKERPWDIGFLFRKDTKTSGKLAELVANNHSGLQTGMNQPYVIDGSSDWFVPVHGEQRDMPHSLIEIRNDHLQQVSGQQWWAEMLSAIIEQYLQENIHDINT
ncbi:MAG: N-formylglutamate amidohydrolase [Cohaesibacteraceae bacterium]|nr:N-formylglutamate amidohydrolase [Cohaesibacteraceae bacterium]